MTDVNKLREERAQLQREISELMGMRAKLAGTFLEIDRFLSSFL